LSLIILVLIFVNVKTLTMLLLFTGPRATYMALAGDLVPTGTTLVTPAIKASKEIVPFQQARVRSPNLGVRFKIF